MVKYISVATLCLFVGQRYKDFQRPPVPARDHGEPGQCATARVWVEETGSWQPGGRTHLKERVDDGPTERQPAPHTGQLPHRTGQCVVRAFTFIHLRITHLTVCCTCIHFHSSIFALLIWQCVVRAFTFIPLRITHLTVCCTCIHFHSSSHYSFDSVLYVHSLSFLFALLIWQCVVRAFTFIHPSSHTHLTVCCTCIHIHSSSHYSFDSVLYVHSLSFIFALLIWQCVVCAFTFIPLRITHLTVCCMCIHFHSSLHYSFDSVLYVHSLSFLFALLIWQCVVCAFTFIPLCITHLTVCCTCIHFHSSSHYSFDSVLYVHSLSFLFALLIWQCVVHAFTFIHLCITHLTVCCTCIHFHSSSHYSFDSVLYVHSLSFIFILLIWQCVVRAFTFIHLHITHLTVCCTCIHFHSSIFVLLIWQCVVRAFTFIHLRITHLTVCCTCIHFHSSSHYSFDSVLYMHSLSFIFTLLIWQCVVRAFTFIHLRITHLTVCCTCNHFHSSSHYSFDSVLYVHSLSFIFALLIWQCVVRVITFIHLHITHLTVCCTCIHFHSSIFVLLIWQCVVRVITFIHLHITHLTVCCTCNHFHSSIFVLLIWQCVVRAFTFIHLRITHLTVCCTCIHFHSSSHYSFDSVLYVHSLSFIFALLIWQCVVHAFTFIHLHITHLTVCCTCIHFHSSSYYSFDSVLYVHSLSFLFALLIWQCVVRAFTFIHLRITHLTVCCTCIHFHSSSHYSFDSVLYVHSLSFIFVLLIWQCVVRVITFIHLHITHLTVCCTCIHFHSSIFVLLIWQCVVRVITFIHLHITHLTVCCTCNHFHSSIFVLLIWQCVVRAFTFIHLHITHLTVCCTCIHFHSSIFVLLIWQCVVRAFTFIHLRITHLTVCCTCIHFHSSSHYSFDSVLCVQLLSFIFTLLIWQCVVRAFTFIHPSSYYSFDSVLYVHSLSFIFVLLIWQCVVHAFTFIHLHITHLTVCCACNYFHSSNLRILIWQCVVHAFTFIHPIFAYSFVTCTWVINNNDDIWNIEFKLAHCRLSPSNQGLMPNSSILKF